MVLTRATNQPGPDGSRRSSARADDIHDATNRDSPFVDQSQTYTSHASHQIFLREYVDNTAGRPVSTGKLISLPRRWRQAPWSQVKAQAAALLGLQLVDTDVFNVPMIVRRPVRQLHPGPARGLPQYVHGGRPGRGRPRRAGVLGARERAAHRHGVPGRHRAQRGADTFDNEAPGRRPPTPDGLDVGTTPSAPGARLVYDNELLDAHFLCGDGRLNENIALHGRAPDLPLGARPPGRRHQERAAQRHLRHHASHRLADAGRRRSRDWNGARLFQAARFVTEMEYQHLVFEEFARKIQPLINPFEPFAFNQTDTNASVRAEFAHAVYRFGHSMLTETSRA